VHELERHHRVCHRARAMRACLAMLAALLVPSLGRAQDPPRVAVLAVGGTTGAEARAWIDSMEALEARLREAGYALDDSGVPRRDDCAELECLREERTSRALDMLVTLTLFGDERAEGIGSVVVSIVDASGQYVGDESVDGRVVSTVAALALAEARSARERGAEPWVRVGGTSGAIVRIDGREVGVVPYEGRVTPGPHRVEASLGGRAPFAREIEARAGETVALEATLGAAPRGDDTVAAGVLFGLAGAAALGGGVALGLGADWNARSGACVGSSGPPCAGYVGPGAGDGALIAGGAQLGAAVGLALVGVLVLAIE
jgi:hypothetical protein